MVLKPRRPTSEGQVLFEIPNASKQAFTWYKVVGDLSSTSPALIALHGGPGAGHQYLSSLIDLYDRHHIPIVFYDQIGCGNSTHFQEKMGDEGFWTVDLFLRELENLIDHLELRISGFYILGQSWGGALAGEYAARRPKGLKKSIIASGPSDLSLFAKGTQRLLQQLPDDVRKILEASERNGDYESPEYEKANAVYMNRHICKLDPWPQPLQNTFATMKDDPTVYMTMQGPSDFHVLGSLRDWEGWSKAHLIDVPVLLLSGRYDNVQDVSIKPWYENIAKVTWIIFENSSHVAHWEERERYMDVVGSFLVD